MFDLEQSIADWREQMFTAGLSTNALDELESHLRDEIDRQLHSGLSACESFTLAVKKIGPAKTLKQEFKKNPGLHGFFFRRFTAIPGILAVLWFIGSSHDLMITAGWWYTSPHGMPRFNLSFGLMSIFLTGAGCAGSFLLLVGSQLGIRILRSVALVYLIICFAQCIPNLGQATDWRIWCGCFAAFSLLTIWLLHRTPKQTIIT